MVFILLDAAVILTAYGLAEAASLRDRAPADYLHKLAFFLAVTLTVQLIANWCFGLYGRIWRHAGIEEARNIVLSCLATLLVLTALYPLGFSEGVTRVPFLVLPLGCLLSMLGIGVLRFHSRLLGFQRANRGMGLRVGVIGSRDAGAAVVRGMLRNPEAGLSPVAVFDDDRRTHGYSLMGVPVVGSIDDIPAMVAKLQIQQILLAVPDPSTTLVERCVRLAEEAKTVLKIVPDLRSLVGSVSAPSVSVRSAREPRIEDLLGRHEVVTDLAAVRRALEGRRVLVTGAGGSIGSEICRQVAGFSPEVLVMLDHDETHLHDVSQLADCKAEQVLADISRRDAVFEVFSRWQPEVVFHAAAHKHVPILETHVVEAVNTNVLGMKNVLDAAAHFHAERFVFISTDKAVSPASVMGATKRVGEQLLLAHAPEGKAYCAVRFGNVLGSRGSVIPTFRRQIAAGGPVTVTDPHMTRFFMSVEEAVQLVLQSAVLAERGDVYMLEMGQPVSILDLAKRMIRLSGLHPGTDIQIRIIGPRVGERLHEQLHSPSEHLVATEHPSVLRLQRSSAEYWREDRLETGLAELSLAAADRNEVRSRRVLFDMVGEDVQETEDMGDMGDIDAKRTSRHALPSVAVEDEIPA
ncbi:MAG TPA: nucleoside-diphosphate sugar epimerase/dehydratase [Acidimicrobiales bacterium]|nr:nucleoside-diphosphate sugar epimerase/dehydratase [Acidimicrobiales bacterium]